jgi:hypothetical protein
MLKDGLNEIRFSNALQEGKDYGFSISRITLAPAASAAMPARTLRVEPPLIAANRWIDFNAAIRPMLDYGFSGDEPGGIWTDGRYARIRFKLPANVSAGIFKAELVPYFDAVHTHVRISVEVNGSKGPSTEFRAPAKPETLSIPFQIDANRGSGKVELALEFDETGKPGKGDQRNLALFFKRFMIEQPAL